MLFEDFAAQIFVKPQFHCINLTQYFPVMVTSKPFHNTFPIFVYHMFFFSLETLTYHTFILHAEQNLKRLRDINEEIQKLRMVNSQRGSREVLLKVVSSGKKGKLVGKRN